MTGGENSDGEFDPHEWPFFWASQLAGRYHQKLDTALKKSGLDVSRYRVLMCVGDHHMNISEIADLAIVKLPTMMKIIQRMEAEGLVVSQPRPSDGRFTDVSLTERGKALRIVAWRSANDLYRTSFAGVGARDEKQLNKTLRQVFEALDR